MYYVSMLIDKSKQRYKISQSSFTRMRKWYRQSECRNNEEMKYQQGSHGK